MRLATLLLIAGCGRISFDPQSDIAIDGATPLGPWSAPVPLFTEPRPLDDPSMTADELELYVNNDKLVMVSVRASREEPWGPLQPVDFGLDITQPHISADGLTLYMNNFNRVVVSTRVSRTDAWSVPVLVPELNTPTDGQDAAPRSDELELVLDLGDGVLVLVRRADRREPWGPPEPIPALDVPAAEGCLGERGLALYFRSQQPGRDLDIYRAMRPALDQPFGAPEPVIELNANLTTPIEDSDPWLSDDGRTIYFTTGRAGGRTIWMATR